MPSSRALLFGRAVVATAALAVSALPTHAQPADPSLMLLPGLHYVTDRLRLPVRDAPRDDATAVATITSGEALVVTDTSDDGYARVRLDSGTEGWVHVKHLVLDPPASVRLNELEEELAILRIEKAQLTGLSEALRLDKAELASALARSEAEQDRLAAELARTHAQAALADTTPGGAIVEAQAEALREQVRLLHIRNRELHSRTEQWWFLAGGSVAIACVLLGLFASRIVTRRRSGW